MKVITHFQLCIISQWENAAPQHLLSQSPKKIRLVFLFIIPCHNVYIPIPFFQTGIMPGSNPTAIQPVCPLRQHTEFEQRITHDTWIGSPSLAIFINEVSYDCIFERYTFISYIVFDSHPGRQLSGILRFISPNPHGYSHYLVSLLLQHQAGGSAVYAATHAH